MIFGLVLKIHAMKKLFYLIISVIILSSCATANETRVSKSELRKEKKFARQAIVENAVESKRFIIRFDRIYFSHGGRADLVPRSNFIIIDGEKAVISAAYLGRQFGFRPVAGINMVGRTTEYDLTGDPSKGKYDVDVKVDNRRESFSVYLTIGADGSCTASLSGVRLSNVRYSGHLVPLKEKESQAPLRRGDLI